MHCGHGLRISIRGGERAYGREVSRESDGHISIIACKMLCFSYSFHLGLPLLLVSSLKRFVQTYELIWTHEHVCMYVCVFIFISYPYCTAQPPQPYSFLTYQPLTHLVSLRQVEWAKAGTFDITHADHCVTAWPSPEPESSPVTIGKIISVV